MERSSSEVISASEIAKFDFCPFGWYIEKKGLISETDKKEQSENEAILRGIAEHKKLAVEVEKYRERSVISVILFLALLFIFLYISLTLLTRA